MSRKLFAVVRGRRKGRPRRFGSCVLFLVGWLAVGLAFGQDEHLRFISTTIASGVGVVTAATLGPDGNLYYATNSFPHASGTDGKILRQQLNPVTGLAVGAAQQLYFSPGENILGIEFDPSASADDLRLWTTFNGGNPNVLFRSKLGRVDLPPVGEAGAAVRQDYIVNLPAQNTGSKDHQLNQMDFGPDGLLYFNVGSQSPQGNSQEVMLSAAMLVADVNAPGFLVNGNPVDVNTSTGYNPFAPGAKVRLYATGVRNAYDLVWHSNGHAYTAINGNDTGGTLPNDPGTPANEAVASPSSSMSEQLSLVVENGYYGHPNPSRGEYITHGGNTGANDPWQHTLYPFPTQPEPGWNPAYNFPLLSTVTSASLSPNAIAEYTANTGLNNWLLVGYYQARDDYQRIQAFQLDQTTGLVIDNSPLLDEDGDPLVIGLPLDIAVDRVSGRIYVGSATGNLLMLSPVAAPLFGDYNNDGKVSAADYTVWRDSLGSASLVNEGPGISPGTVDEDDFKFWTAHYGETQSIAGNGTSLAAVPEPSAMGLGLPMLAAAGVALNLRRRSRSVLTFAAAS